MTGRDRAHDTVHGHVHVLVVGPKDHGVVKHGLELADAAGAPVLHLADVAELDATMDELPEAIHVSFTDALFGGPAEAPERIRALAHERKAWLGLHDVPQDGEGEDRLRRRRACYATICDDVTGIVVNSEHEQRCLAAAGATVTPHVIPLPIPDLGPAGRIAQLENDGAGEIGGQGDDSIADQPGAPERAPVIGVFGFLYPGKGVDDVIDAAAELHRSAGRPVGVVNIGGVSDGHQILVDELADRALAAGVGFRVTGHVDDRDLPAALAAVDVPVIAHRHISASGSLNSWLALGRRPIAVTGDYVDEVAARWPGHIRVVDRPDLAGAIADALEDPASTWADAPVDWGWADVARAHREVWR